MRHHLWFALQAFLLNFLWESWHAAYLYKEGFGLVFDSPTSSLTRFVRLITYASCMDALLLSGILLGGSIWWRHREWFTVMNFPKYSYFVLLTLLVAVGIEYKAVFLFHQWSYNDRMPLIFGLGLSPLLQLPLTGLLSLWIARQST